MGCPLLSGVALLATRRPRDTRWFLLNETTLRRPKWAIRLPFEGQEDTRTNFLRNKYGGTYVEATHYKGAQMRT